MRSFIIFSLATIAFSQQTQPIPVFQDGFAYGPSSSNYTLDVFYDHLCDGSAAVFPGLFSFWSNNQSWLRMVIHIYPLPYHYYSFDVGRAGRFIQLNYPQNFTSFLNYIFKHQDEYLDLAKYWNQADLYKHLSTSTQTATGVPYSLIESALNNSTYDYSLRTSWKFATSKAITGTPQYMLNGIWVPSAESFDTVQDWENFFNSLS